MMQYSMFNDNDRIFVIYMYMYTIHLYSHGEHHCNETHCDNENFLHMHWENVEKSKDTSMRIVYYFQVLEIMSQFFM